MTRASESHLGITQMCINAYQGNSVEHHMVVVSILSIATLVNNEYIFHSHLDISVDILNSKLIERGNHDGLSRSRYEFWACTLTASPFMIVSDTTSHFQHIKHPRD